MYQQLAEVHLNFHQICIIYYHNDFYIRKRTSSKACGVYGSIIELRISQNLLAPAVVFTLDILHNLNFRVMHFTYNFQR